MIDDQSPFCMRKSLNASALEKVLPSCGTRGSTDCSRVCLFNGGGLTKVGIEMMVARRTFNDERVRRKRIVSCFLASTGFRICNKYNAMFRS